jgi:hypothetical protein
MSASSTRSKRWSVGGVGNAAQNASLQRVAGRAIVGVGLLDDNQHAVATTWSVHRDSQPEAVIGQPNEYLPPSPAPATGGESRPRATVTLESSPPAG